MNVSSHATAAPAFGPTRRFAALSARARKNDLLSAHDLNTLEQALSSARLFSSEIRRDTKARRVYRTFFAMTQNHFEALLAFSIWKVRGSAHV